jgi:HPt (histidine-containing phosphotransfer) domain-containing protein
MIFKAVAVDLQLHSSSDVTLQRTDAVSIDLTYLQEFSGGDRIFIRDMIETFLSETPTCLNSLKDSLRNAEWSEAYKIVHRLKPNLMMLGMHAQQELAATIESAIKQEDFVAAELEEEVADLCLAIEASFSLLQQKLKAL